MSEEDWVDAATAMRRPMLEWVHPTVTPVSCSDTGEFGWSWGTANYLSVEGASWILTNDHVDRDRPTKHLAHLPVPGGDFRPILEPFVNWPHPIDLAIAKVDALPAGAPRRLLRRREFDVRYDPVPGEFLFWLGYTSTTSRRNDPLTEHSRRYSWFGELETVGTPVVSQQFKELPAILPVGWSPDHHVLVHYSTMAIETPGKPMVEVRNPVGMSGSLLWDTKLAACIKAGIPWSPEKARVYGLLWGSLENPGAVVATRVEHLLSELCGMDS